MAIMFVIFSSIGKYDFFVIVHVIMHTFLYAHLSFYTKQGKFLAKDLIAPPFPLVVYPSTHLMRD